MQYLKRQAAYAVLGIAFVVAGPITNAFGARWVYAGASATILIAAVVAWRLVRGADAEPAAT